MVSCSGLGLPLHAQLLRLFVTTHKLTGSGVPRVDVHSQRIQRIKQPLELEHPSGSPSQNHLQNQSVPGTAEDQKSRSSPSRTLKSTGMADAVYTSVLLSTFFLAA